MIRTLYVCSLAIVVFISNNADTKQSDGGLYLVHIITRHGERTPRQSYPKDPHKNERYYPVGYGQLTKKGKLRMYNVGITIKQNYQKFLGNFYLPWQVKARSSAVDRTQMTGQLIMAGMYPPKTAQIWNKNLTWQPIPINMLTPKDDRIFLPEESCRGFSYLRKQHVQDAKNDGQFRKYQYLFKNLHKATGLTMEVPENVMRLHDTLKCQKEWGLKLPSWANDYYPEAMEDIAVDYWKDYAPTDEMKKLSAGHMFKKIVDETTKKMNGDADYKEMKFFLYSAHDSNIVSLLQLLGIYDPHIIPYGAYIAIEIHKKGNGYTVKVYYQNNKSKNPKIMHLNGCSKPCDFNDFVNIYKKYFPNLGDC